MGRQSVVKRRTALAGKIPELALYPAEQILADLLAGNSTFIEYFFYNPEKDFEQQKRSCLVLYDGYIFGSGYYISPEVRVERLVDDTIAEYNQAGEDGTGAAAVFEGINALDSSDPHYPFVLNATTLEVVAEGAYPELVGTSAGFVLNGDLSLEWFRLLPSSYKTFLVSYPFENSATDTVQHKSSVLTSHDGYFFGSGYHVPSKLTVRQTVDLMINLYARFHDLLQRFEIARLSHLGPAYPFILDGTHMGTVASIGDSDPVSLSTILATPDRPNAMILADLESDEGT